MRPWWRPKGAMGRIRTIKPKFFKNEDLAALPYQCRLLFIGLWTEADKEGRLEDRPKRLKAELFPYDDLDINEELGRLAHAGFLTRYESNGIRYIAIPTWEKHQHPNQREEPSALPPPPQVQCTHVHAPVEQEGKGREQEGNGTNALRARFERFWASYPRKVGKDGAWAVFQRLRPDDALTEAMIEAVERARGSRQWLKDGGQFIPHPRTWLHQGRWQDEGAEGRLERRATLKPGEEIDLV